MIKLVIFDLDGVLIDSKNYHFEALNLALGEKYAISREEHLKYYDGLPTSEKLKLLSEKKGLSPKSLIGFGKISKHIPQIFLKQRFHMIMS